MEMGLGWLRLPPDAFWSLTLRELFHAINGYQETRGGESPSARHQMFDELQTMFDRAA